MAQFRPRICRSSSGDRVIVFAFKAEVIGAEKQKNLFVAESFAETH
jgi:hypothetical protein